MKTNHIDAFVQETGLTFHKGEIGFGRPCVGILNPETESYIAYQTYDRDYNTKLMHEVAMNTQPEDAYHKGPYLAVLHDGSAEGEARATEQLNEWIEKIMAAAYEIESYEETNSLASLMHGGSVKQKALTGGVSFAKFLEIF